MIFVFNLMIVRGKGRGEWASYASVLPMTGFMIDPLRPSTPHPFLPSPPITPVLFILSVPITLLTLHHKNANPSSYTQTDGHRNYKALVVATDIAPPGTYADPFPSLTHLSIHSFNPQDPPPLPHSPLLLYLIHITHPSPPFLIDITHHPSSIHHQ